MSPTQYPTSFFARLRPILVNAGVPQAEITESLQALGEWLSQESFFSQWGGKEWRGFLEQQQATGALSAQSAESLSTLPSTLPAHQAELALPTFELALGRLGSSSVTIRNYRSDIQQFLAFCQSNDVRVVFDKKRIESFSRYNEEKGLSQASIRRRVSSLSQLANWARSQGAEVPDSQTSNSSVNPKEAPTSKSSTLSNEVSSLKTQVEELKKKLDKGKASWLFSWLPLVAIFLFFLGLGTLGYSQLIKNTPTLLAYPSSPVTPTRTVSFQGRLTDSAQNPITVATNFTFKLYDTGPSTSGGTELWTSGTCSITPDQDGIFNSLLGSSCGSEITQDVFSERSEVWLQVQVGAETLSPRQRIGTVPYALNSETLQGYPIAATGAATANTVVTMNSSGDIVLGEVSPEIRSSSGTFVIEGSTLQLQTSSNGNIIFDANGIGGVVSRDYVFAPGATVSATYAGGVPLTVMGGPSGTGNLVNFQTSGGSNLVTIDSTGLITTASDLAVNGDDITSDGNLTLNAAGYVRVGDSGAPGTATGDDDLYVESDVEIDGTLYTDGTIDTAFTSNGGLLYTNGSGVVAQTAIGSAGECLTSIGGGTPAWASCSAAGGNLWRLANGAVSPINDTLDLLIGSNATTSAKFAVKNVGSGTPTATISANSGNIATYLTGDGTLGATNRNTLTIGNSSAYNTTGNVLINPNGTGYVGIGTTAPIQPLDVGGTIRSGSGAAGGSVMLQGNYSNGSLNNFGSLFSSGATFMGYSVKPDTGTANGYLSSTGINIGRSAIETNNAFVRFLTGAAQTSTDGGAVTMTEKVRIDSNGNVGIGTTAPDAALEINHATGDSLRLTYNDSNGSAANYVDYAVSSGGDLTVTPSGGDSTLVGQQAITKSGADQNYQYQGVLQYHLDSAAQTGAVVITVPNPGSTMLNIKISGYHYANNYGAWEVILGGYWFSGGPQWINTSVAIKGTPPFTRVRLMTESGAPRIVLGDVTDTWEYPQINVDLSVAGLNTQSSWGAGWSGAMSTDLSALTADDEPLIKYFTTSTGNFGIRDVSPDAFLEVLGTTEQLRLTHTDGTVDARITVNASGDLAIDGSSDGTGSETFTLTGYTTLSSALTTFNCTDCINFDDLADSMSVDAATDINLGAFALTIDMDSTGDFSIRDGATDIATFTDSGAITFAPTTGVVTVTGDVAVNGGDITSTSALAVTPTTTLTLNSTGDMTLDSSTDIILDADGADIFFKDAGTTFATFTQSSNDVALDVAGGNFILASGDVLNVGGSALAYNSFGTGTATTPDDGSDVYIADELEVDGTIRLRDRTYTFPASESVGYILQTDGSGTLSWVDPLAQTGYWRLTSGALSPINNTLDLLIGSNATTSAKFAVKNVNSGTPTATISANSGNIATYLTGDGTLATTNRNTLTIGNSSTYDTTGNVLINSNGQGNVGIGTTSPLSARLAVAGPQWDGANTGNIWSYDTGTLGADKGGGLLLGGYYTGTTPTVWSAISGLKENATDGNYAGYLSLKTRANGGTLTEQMRISSAGNVGIGLTTPGAKLDVRGDVFAPIATFSANYAAGVPLTVKGGPSGSGNLTNWQNSAGSTLAYIDASGHIVVAGNIGIAADTDLLQLASNALTVNGSVTATGDVAVNGDDLTSDSNLTINATGYTRIGDTASPGTATGDDDLFVESDIEVDGVLYTDGTIDTAFTSNGGILYTNGSGVVAQTAIGNSGECLTSIGGGTPAWTSCSASSGNLWRLANGALSPVNDTTDLLIGANSTTSAKFRFINVNTGTPIASVSANSGNIATYLTGDGTLGATNRNSLTIGNSSAYNTTGNILLNPNGQGNVGIGTTNPGARLEIVDNGSVASPLFNIKADDAGPWQLNIQNDTYDSASDIRGMRMFVNNAGLSSIYAADDGTTPGHMTFLTDETERLRITSTGNVGIGTTTPGAKLQVFGDVFAPIATFSANYSGGVPLTVKGAPTSGNIANFQDSSSSNLVTISSAGLITTASDVAVNGGDITSTGALAITPAGTLTLNSTGLMTLDSSTDINLDADGSDIVFLDGGSTFATFTNASTDLTIVPTGGDVNITGTLDVSGHGAFGSSGSIDTARTLNVRENYTSAGSGTVTYSGYYSQVRTEAAVITADTSFRGIYNDNTYRITEDLVGGFDGDAYGLQNAMTTDGSYTYRQIMGELNTVSSTSIAMSNQDALYGGRNDVYNNGTGVVSNVYGINARSYNNAAGGVTNAYGVYGHAFTNHASATTSAAYGVYGAVNENGGGTITSGRALNANCDDATTCYSLFLEAIDTAGPTDAYGIWADSGDWVLDEDGANDLGGTTGGGDLFLGEGQDLRIYHDGTNSNILNTTGALNLTTTTTLNLDAVTDITLDADGADISFLDGGATYATFTNSTTDLILDVAGGNLILADGDLLNIGGIGAVGYNAIADSSTATSQGLASDDDLFVEGDVEINGTLFTDGSIDTVFTSNGGILYTNASGVVAQTAIGSSGECLTSIGGGTPAWTSCSAAGGNLWRLTSGALSPINDTADLLIGAASTASAKFRFINVNTGTPVASVSANSGNIATYLTGDGTLSTTNRQLLTIGNNSTYNTTGDVVINSNNQGNVGIGTTTPSTTLHVNGTSHNFGRISTTNTTGNLGLQFVNTGDANEDWVLGRHHTGYFYVSNDTGVAAERFVIDTAGNVGVGDVSPAALFTVGNGDLFQVNSGGEIATIDGVAHTFTDSSGDLAINSNGGNVIIASGDVLNVGLGTAAAYNYFASSLTGVSGTTISAATDLYVQSDIEIEGTVRLADRTYTFPSSETANYILRTDGSGALSWVDPQAQTGYWRLASGALSPINDTVDILFGASATASAKFKFLNMNTGTPVASVSANSGNISTYITGDGTLATTNRNSLTIGNSSAYNTTGDLLIHPNGTGRVGVGTTAPGSLLEISSTTGTAAITPTALRISTTSNANDWDVNTTWGNLDFYSADAGAPGASVRARIGALASNTAGTLTSLVFYSSDTSGLAEIARISDNGALLFNDTANANNLRGITINQLGQDAEIFTLKSSDIAHTMTSITEADTYGFLQKAAGATGGLLIRGLTDANAANPLALHGTFGTTNPTDTIPAIILSGNKSDGAGSAAVLADAETVLQINNLSTVLATLLGNGNLGIGTVTPAAKLQVFGDIFAPTATFSANYANGVPLTVKGAPTSGNILNIQDSAATNLAFFNTTGDLTLNNQLDLRLSELTANGSSYISFQAPASLSTNYTYTLPSDYGTNGYFLTTNGSGTLTWGNGSGITNFWQLNNGVLSPFSLTAEVNLGATATASAKISLAGSLTRGQAVAIFNQTEDQDILAASVSGSTRFRVDTNGYVHAGRFVDLTNSSTFLDPAATDISLTVLGKSGLGVTSPVHQLQVETSTLIGKALTVLNETGNQSILVASKSGTRVFEIGNEGDATMGAITKPDIDLTLYGDLFQQGGTNFTALSNITDVFIYDTTQDSDKGAWTDSANSQGLSWYTETKDDGVNVPCVIASHDRCGRNAFPKKSILVTTTDGLYIFDAQDNTLWMKFTQTATAQLGVNTNNDPNSVFAYNGHIYVGTVGSAPSIGLVEIDFTTDRSFTYDTVDRAQGTTSIANRNSATTYATNAQTNFALPSVAIRDVHIQAIAGKTYVALATDTTLTVINRTDGRVFSYSDVTSDDYEAVWLTSVGHLYGLNSTQDQLERWSRVIADTASETNQTPDKVWDQVSTPALTNLQPDISTGLGANQSLFIEENTSAGGTGSEAIYVGTDRGVTRLSNVIDDEARGSVKYYTTDYITEEMMGRIKDMNPMMGTGETTASTTFTNFDASVNGNLFTTVGAGTTPNYVSGVRGTALEFDGSDYICTGTSGTCADDDDFDFATTEYTFGAWVKFSGTVSAVQTIMTKGGLNSGAVGYSLYTDTAGKFVCGTDDDTTFTPDDSVTSVLDYDDGQWHHVVCRVDRGATQGEINLFVDGVEAGTADTSISASATTSNTAAFRVGADGNATPAQFFNGQMDEVFVTNETISNYLIRSMYLNGRQALQKRYLDLSNSDIFSSTTIGLAGQTWTPNEFVGAIVELTGGVGVDQTRRVVSNSATTLTVSPSFATTPTATSDFAIKPHELYGATPSAKAITVTKSKADNSKTMYVTTKHTTSGGGGVTAIKLEADTVTDVYHNDAGKTDEAGNAWSTTATYDDDYFITAKSDVLAIGSAGHYWHERSARSFTQMMDQLLGQTGSGDSSLSIQNANTSQMGGQVLASLGHVDNGYQVIRKGWAYINGQATPTLTDTLSYGITYDDYPMIFTNYQGHVTTAIAPRNLGDCSTTSNNFFSWATAITKTGFDVYLRDNGGSNFSSSDFICLSWMAIGTVSSNGPSQQFAAGADLAEWYATPDHTLQAGEIVSVNSSGNISVVRSGRPYDSTAIGIIATRPALTLGPESGLTPGYAPQSVASGSASVRVALAGRVPVKVSLENGPILAGDALTTSSTPGIAMRATQAGPIIGKAMENFDGKSTIIAIAEAGVPLDESMSASDSAQLAALEKQSFTELDSGIGTIMAFVNTSYADPSQSSSSDLVNAQNGGKFALNSSGNVIGLGAFDAANFQQMLYPEVPLAAAPTTEAATDSAQVATASAAVSRPQLIQNTVAKIGNLGSLALKELTAVRASILGRLFATQIETEELTADTAVINNLETDEITTDSLVASTFKVTSPDNTTLFQITASGSATLLSDLIVGGNASVAGEITAESARLDTLESRLAQVEHFRAQTAEITTATVSGTLYAGTIDGLDEKVAAALAKPTLLQTLLGQTTQVPGTAPESLPALADATISFASPTTATTSAQALRQSLADLDLSGDQLAITGAAAYFDNYFQVNGNAFVADSLGVGNQIVVGDGLRLTANSIETTQSILSLQPSGLGKVDILAGRFTITDDGNATISGRLAVTGPLEARDSLLTNLIAPLNPNDAVRVKVAGVSDTGETIASRFEIVDQIGAPVATISAQGAASFAGGATADSLKLATQDATTTQGNEILVTKSVGKATLPAGQNELKLKSTLITPTTLIQLTAMGDTSNQPFFVKSIVLDDPATPDNEAMATIGLTNPLDHNVDLSWWLIGS